ncbi:MAG TPA: hypothetical protein VF092_11445 [Longimicrobium sp.]
MTKLLRRIGSFDPIPTPHPAPTMPTLSANAADLRASDRPSPLPRILRTGLVTGVVDGIWAIVLVTVFYHSTFARLWQGVAATLLGQKAFDGGARTIAIGLLMHFGVALGWSAVFVLLADRWRGLDRLLASRWGTLKVAAIYGPFIWMVMSLIVIPALTRRPPRITVRWLIQLLGHIPFVGLPIVATAGRSPRAPAS